MAREDQTYTVTPTILTVPLGVTNGVYFGQQNGRVSVTIKNNTSAATLLILPTNSGSTYAGATLAALTATFGYSVDTGQTGSVTISGPAAFYLAASGATATVHLMINTTSGF